MSTSSLHQLIAACSIKLKPTNYLIKRTQISHLIQITENELSKSNCSTGQSARKVVVVEKDAEDSGNIIDWKEKYVLLRSWISVTLTEESMYLIMGCSTAKEMWECLEKTYIQATKVINFARGLGLKYKTFRTVILGKAPYPTLNQFVYALTSFDTREDEKDVSQQNHNMVFSSQKGRGRGNNNINSRETCFKLAGQGTSSKN
ncbi:hypothetical protein KY284_007607 [Solanum tuberosum]|nr:hypothetical protein KY284_007607 [Solanum tuberosum]